MLDNQVSSMTGSPLNSLYHSVHSVYAPALLKNEASRQGLSGKVQVMVERLALSRANAETTLYVANLDLVSTKSLRVQYFQLVRARTTTRCSGMWWDTNRVRRVGR